MEKLTHEILQAVLAFLASLVPSTIGAIVSMVYEPGLTWAQRAARLWVGVTVSYFVQRAGGAVLDLHPYVLQSVAFVTGMIAYRAAPAFMTGATTALGELPGLIRDRVIDWLPSRKEKK